MTRSITPAAAPATDTRNIKRSRQDDLALLGTLRADARLPNRAKADFASRRSSLAGEAE